MMCFVFQAVVNKEGNRLKVVLNKVTSVTELVDENTLVNVSKISVYHQRT